MHHNARTTKCKLAKCKYKEIQIFKIQNIKDGIINECKQLKMEISQLAKVTQRKLTKYK